MHLKILEGVKLSAGLNRQLYFVMFFGSKEKFNFVVWWSFQGAGYM